MYAGVVELADTLGSDRSAACGRDKRLERVAAVGVQRRHAAAKAHTGNRNRTKKKQTEYMRAWWNWQTRWI